MEETETKKIKEHLGDCDFYGSSDAEGNLKKKWKTIREAVEDCEYSVDDYCYMIWACNDVKTEYCCDGDEIFSVILDKLDSRIPNSWDELGDQLTDEIFDRMKNCVVKELNAMIEEKKIKWDFFDGNSAIGLSGEQRSKILFYEE